jgi:hypothetical protein
LNISLGKQVMSDTRINNKAEALLTSSSFPRRYFFENVSGRSPGSRT